MAKFRVLESAVEQYKQIKEAKLKGEPRNQIERAAYSVCLNLQEGNARAKTNDRKLFFNIAYSSQKEVQLILMLEGLNHIEELADKVAAQCFKLWNRPG